MKNVITISREYGSCNREIDQRLAEYFDISFIDSKAVDKLCNQRHVYKGCLKRTMKSGITHCPLFFNNPLYHLLPQGILKV